MLTIHLISTFPPLLANLNSTFLTEYPHHPNCYWHHGRRICYGGVKPPHNADLVDLQVVDEAASEMRKPEDLELVAHHKFPKSGCFYRHGRKYCVKPPHNTNLVDLQVVDEAADSNDKGETKDFSYNDDSYDDKDAKMNTEDETVWFSRLERRG